MKIETNQILSNPHARQAYYDELRKRRSEAGAQKSEPPPAPSPQPRSRAAELLEQLRATPEPAPVEGEWEVGKRHREEFEEQKRTEQMLRLHFEAVRRRLRELGIRWP